MTFSTSPCWMHHITPGETRSLTWSALDLLITVPGATSARSGAAAAAASQAAASETRSSRAIMGRASIDERQRPSLGRAKSGRERSLIACIPSLRQLRRRLPGPAPADPPRPWRSASVTGLDHVGDGEELFSQSGLGALVEVPARF